MNYTRTVTVHGLMSHLDIHRSRALSTQKLLESRNASEATTVSEQTTKAARFGRNLKHSVARRNG